MLRQSRLLRRAHASLAPHKRVEFQRERAFGIVWIKRIQFLGDDEPQHAVAQELQSLIRFRAHAGMAQRARQQLGIGEFVSEACFDFSQ